MAAGLGVAALLIPAQLYVIALALFGLPHVLCELAWVWKAWGKAVPKSSLIFLGLALLIQVLSRLAQWQGRVDIDVAALCDAVSLALALMSMIALWPRVPLRRRPLLVLLALGMPALLVSVADTPAVLLILAALAIAHNFTPVALAPQYLRLGPWPARKVLLALFAAPFLLFVALLLLEPPDFSPTSITPPELSGLWAGSPRILTAAIPALVWAQCLHYLSVIYLIPHAMPGGGAANLPRPMAWLACGLLSVYFLADFNEARRLYAVAAGLHAWLEWPLILMIVVRPAVEQADYRVAEGSLP